MMAGAATSQRKAAVPAKLSLSKPRASLLSGMRWRWVQSLESWCGVSRDRVASHGVRFMVSHCYLSEQRFHFCFERFHSRLLFRWAALSKGNSLFGFRVSGSGSNHAFGLG